MAEGRLSKAGVGGTEVERDIQNCMKNTSFRQGREDGDERQGVGMTNLRYINAMGNEVRTEERGGMMY